MAEVLRFGASAVYLVGPVVALIAVARRGGRAAGPASRDVGWCRLFPPLVLPLEWAATPVLIALAIGEVPGDWPIVRGVGFTLAVGGAAVIVWAAVSLGPYLVHRAAVATDHALVTNGPFRFVRH